MRVHPRNRALLEVRTHDTPLLRGVLLPAQNFLHTAGLGGAALIVAAIIAVGWANSPLRDSYQNLWHSQIGFHIFNYRISEDLRHLVNDVLMVIFFYVAGLEIKRAFVAGELADRKHATLPILGALGGMIVPAGIYLLVNMRSPATLHGWGVPMATDIAFAVGVLALLGSRVSNQLRLFLLALAIVDDVGAIVVIAVFYTPHVYFGALFFAFVFLATMGGLVKLGVRQSIPYVILSIAFTSAIAASGIHATIAGVILGLLTPRAPSFSFDDFLAFLKRNKTQLESSQAKINPYGTELLVAKVQEIAYGTEGSADRLERGFHSWTNFVIVPLFALANAGVAFEHGFLRAALQSPATWGIILGLFLGKPLGVALICWLGIRFKIAQMPQSTSWRQLVGVGLVAGIGFTMSLFIADLAFDSQEIVDAAKVGTFIASILAGAVGFYVLRGASTGATPEKKVAAAKIH
jgi:Na+:H+ antiporter, NhaA family